MLNHPYAGSEALLERAKRAIPGGHHLSGRALVDPERAPAYFDRAKGCRIWDVDGHEFIDYLMAYGAVSLGYANEEVDRAAFSQLSRGGLVSLNHPEHVRFIETLIERFPFAEMGVFMKTGSEATTAALRIARRATGRKKIVRAGYHGWHDWCIPEDPSVATGLAEQILEFRPNDPGSLPALFAANPSEIAAVILAPEMVLPCEAGVFHTIAETTRRHGAVFILDEVKTAFRTAPGSVHQRFGFQPDVLTLSKALGNGWPIAAILGKRSVMESAAGLHLSATYHGDTGPMAAALATLAIVDRDDVMGRVWRMGQQLLDGLSKSAQEHRMPVTVYGEPLPPMPFMRFSHPDSRTNDLLRRTFYSEVLSAGVLLHPRHMWFVSSAHRPEDIAKTVEVCGRAFAVTRRLHAVDLG